MDEEVAKKDATIDALSSALKREKDENKKLKEEKKEYVTNLHTYRKQADETRQIMQADLDKLRTELASASKTPTRCICSKPNELEGGSESFHTYNRLEELQIGSESLSTYGSRIGVASCHAKESLAKRVAHHVFTTDQYSCGFEVLSASIGIQTTCFTAAVRPLGQNTKCMSFHSGLGRSNYLSSDVFLNGDEIYVGFDAELKYKEFTSNNDQPKAAYIRCMLGQLFKTAMDKGLNEYTNVEDASKNLIRALPVFSKCIKYLVDDVFGNIQDSVKNITNEDFKWLFAVPSFWTNTTQQFVLAAAIQAGIQFKQLSIVLEPQAAILLCKNTPLHNLNRNTSDCKDTSTLPFIHGTTCLIVDFGGITTNISLHTIVDKDIRLECSWTSGVSTCYIVYEEALKQLLIPITGKYVYERFRKKQCIDYEDLIFDFKMKCRNTNKHDDTGYCRLTMPTSLIRLCEKVKDMPFKDAVAVSMISVELFRANKLKIHPTFIKGLFENTLKNVINLVREVLQDTASKDVDAVVFVGDFAETILLQEAVTVEFPEIRLIIPANPEFAVLHGTVLYGHTVV